MNANRSRPRVQHTYKIPDKLLGDFGGIKQVTLVELTANEELLCAKRSNGDAMQLPFLLARESVKEADGEQLNTGDSTSDEFWNKISPRARGLLLHAFGRIHNVSREDTDAFFDAVEVVVR